MKFAYNFDSTYKKVLKLFIWHMQCLSAFDFRLVNLFFYFRKLRSPQMLYHVKLPRHSRYLGTIKKTHIENEQLQSTVCKNCNLSFVGYNFELTSHYQDEKFRVTISAVFQIFVHLKSAGKNTIYN